MTGRLQEELLARVVEYGSRILSLADQLEQDHRYRRVIDQIVGSGTSPGANLFEAHEAVSKADFLRCVGWAAKELSESRYWLLLITKRQWIKKPRIEPLIKETVELLSIVKVIIARSRRNSRR